MNLIKINLAVMLLWLSTISTFGQIGINTEDPQALFHIDANGDTGSKTNTIDDVVVTSEGKVGVGRISPDGILDIRGKIDFDKTHKGNRMQVESSATGVARWSSYELNVISIWQLLGSGTTFTENTEVVLSGTSSLLKNDIAGISVSDNEILAPGVTGSVITLPEGRYIMYLLNDIDVAEYGILKVYDVDHLSSPISAEYGFSATGVAFIIENIEPKKYYMTFTALDAKSVIYDAPPYTTTFQAGMIIQKIN